MLGKGGFDLRKWRSSSSQVLNHIPTDLLEPLPTQDLVDRHSASHPKALGVAWDSNSDTMATHIELPTSYTSSKRGIISDVARTFDVLGWLSPSILPMKILFQQLWEEQLDWDDKVPEHFRQKHVTWRTELPLLASIKLPRCYFSAEPAVTTQLHGFSDASEAAYSAVIYLRATYSNSPTTCRLVMSKTKVAPVKTLSVPRLELCGASLLAKILTTTREALNMPLESVFAWCDSSIVLAWLDGSPKRYKTYIGNRIATITNLVPSTAWKHVPTKDNPADCASRGLAPSELRDHHLWWTGPPWLLPEPIQVPKQPQEAELAPLKSLEAKPITVNASIISTAEWIESRFSSFRTLLHVTAWVQWFAHSFLSTIHGHPQIRTNYLSTDDLNRAENFLLKRSQGRSFPAELTHLCASPSQPILASSKLLSVHPFLGQDGLLHVGGRLSKAPIPYGQKYPILISSHDRLAVLLFKYDHVHLGHCGPTLLLSHTGNKYHVLGARQLARTTCRQCVICRKAAAKVENQLMGQLPASRTTPSPPFTMTGIDYAGPFMLKRGHTRKPVLVKSYIAIFVCFATKAVHIEIVSDLTTEAFLAALKRFTLRRGRPSSIHTNNGTNFVGARNDLQELYRFLSSTTAASSINSFLLTNRISWHNIPERAPHFGGLWEAAVKSAKHHLKRVIGQQRLDYEEFSTITAQVEACLNSRPLGALTSHSPDGISPLTPGHFLIGRELQAYPETAIKDDPSLFKRWTLCQALTQHFWRRWSGEYLQQLQKAGKWHKVNPNLQVGDLVLMTDGNIFTTQWVMGKVIETYTGKDNLVRAVDVQTETVCKPPSST